MARTSELKFLLLGLLPSVVVAAPVTLAKNGMDGRWQQLDVDKRFVACMDGSLPQYYISESSSNIEGLRRKWLIYLEDGPICYDEESCDALVAAQESQHSWRYSSRSSSEGWPETITLGGIFDDDPSNYLADYNKVFVPYCTGDSWLSDFWEMGQQGPFFDKYYMKGYGSIYALIDTLAGRNQLGMWDGGEDFVFAGSGEGAIGVMHSVEVEAMSPFAEILQAAVGATGYGLAEDYRMLLVLDSAVEINMDAFDSVNMLSLADRTRALAQLLGIGDQVDQQCRETLGGDEEDNWRCVFGQYTLTHQVYPQVIIQNYFDPRQLAVQLGLDPGCFEWDDLT